MLYPTAACLKYASVSSVICPIHFAPPQKYPSATLAGGTATPKPCPDKMEVKVIENVRTCVPIEEGGDNTIYYVIGAIMMMGILGYVYLQSQKKTVVRRRRRR